jgi:adenine phosphoribosyltransferase
VGLILGDVEFIDKAGREVARAVRQYSPEVIVTAEAKAVAMAYEVARGLGHERFVVIRKSIKGYMRGYITESVKSITTRGLQVLVLTEEDAKLIRGGRVCLFDDVVSTGDTMKALERLIRRASGDVVCEACI